MGILMKRAFLVAMSICVIGAAAYWVAKDSDADHIVAAFKTSLPESAEADVALSGCDLSIRSRISAMDSGSFQHSVLRLNLGHYILHQINLKPAPNGKTYYTAQHKTRSSSLITQVMGVAGSVPSDIPSRKGSLTLLPNSGGQITEAPKDFAAMDKTTRRKEIAEILKTPGQRLSFQLSTLLTQDENGNWDAPRPHKDAPAFHRFAQSLLTNDAEMNFAMTLTYLGNAPQSDSLLTGAIVSPAPISLQLADMTAAKDFARALATYAKKHCS
ncbi:MAG: hypothetical protein N4A53_15280 [Pelagimonas sp.]|nr:hypothetical protein [Pelagimonas sp.]